MDGKRQLLRSDVFPVTLGHPTCSFISRPARQINTIYHGAATVRYQARCAKQCGTREQHPSLNSTRSPPVRIALSLDGSRAHVISLWAAVPRRVAGGQAGGSGVVSAVAAQPTAVLGEQLAPPPLCDMHFLFTRRSTSSHGDSKGPEAWRRAQLACGGRDSGFCGRHLLEDDAQR